MSEELKIKATKGVKWSAIERVGANILQLLILVLLTRFLSPSDFGAIALVMIFVAIGQTIVNTGFSQAFIQKEGASDVDLCSLFYAGLVIAVAMYVGIFSAASYIEDFYGKDNLAVLVRWVSTVILLDALVVAQTSYLIKELNFRFLAKANLPAIVSGGAVAVGMAYAGYGVWSIAGQLIAQRLVLGFFLWTYSPWSPRLIFSSQSIVDLFSFGWKLQMSALLNILSKNLNNVIIGKNFSMNTVGLYYRANSLHGLLMETIVGVIEKVTFPAFSSIRKNERKVLEWNRTTTRVFAFLVYPLVCILFVYSHEVILIAFGKQWVAMAPYLQMLLPIGMIRILHSSNLTLLKVMGRTDIILVLRIAEVCITLGILLVVMRWGLNALILGQVASSYLFYGLVVLMANRITGYSLRQQVADITPYFLVTISVACILYGIKKFMEISPLVDIMIGVILGITIYATLTWFLQLRAYVTFSVIVKNKMY